ncbi:MAG: 2-dehydropantoate 2-reductase [Acidobacteriota bacterium]
MKIVMMGSGGVGGYFGARMALAGHAVSFVARGAHGAAMRRDGLRIESPRGDAHLPTVHVLTEPLEAEVAELVVIAVKLWDTESAARAIQPLIGPSTAIVSLQNGVEKDEAIAEELGFKHVLGGVTYVLAKLAEPGLIVHSGTLQRVLVGELDGSPSARVDAVVAAFRDGGIDVEASPDIRRATWEKFIFLASNSAVTAVTRQTLGAVRTHPATRTLLRDAMREVTNLAQREGITIADDFVEERMRFIDTLPADGRASMANDLLQGHRLELEWLSGTVLRRAANWNLSTPVHRALYAALVLYAEGPPGTVR